MFLELLNARRGYEKKKFENHLKGENHIIS